MRHPGVNPYLPLWEYVPDGEPHVFGDRVYLYGSHDRAGGYNFCLNDYVGWSAPVTDLSDWRYEGVLYIAAPRTRATPTAASACTRPTWPGGRTGGTTSTTRWTAPR